MDIKQLREHAKNIRINIIKQVSNAKSGHPGGSLGATDILTVLYFEVMDITAENVKTKDRDRFVLSKGHASPALYATLAEKGIIPAEELMTFRKLHTRLQGHPDMHSLPGVDMSTGSLGQGLSAAVGMALANRLNKNDHRIYALVGDGEAEEGQIWEAAMAAHHYKLDNLCAVIDENGLQIDGWTKDVISPAPFKEKFEAFGWHVIEIDGHDYEQIKNAFDEAKTVKGRPTCIVAKTIKGKGVSYMENVADWHGKAPDAKLTEVALKDLEGM
ncbi:MAG: transketolase [Solobacterium sp.]|nr:transketolase [Solobacterium sp.]